MSKLYQNFSSGEWFERQYALRKSLPSFAEEVNVWENLSQDKNFEKYHSQIEFYGDDPRQTFELFKVTKNKRADGLAVFIHGGFWRSMERAQSRFMAIPFLNKGMDCAIFEYRLMPQFRLAELVQDTVLALKKLSKIAADAQLSEKRLISGHSAGAHLALHALLNFKKNGLALKDDALLLFSGVFEIFSVSGMSIGDELKMDLKEVLQWSLHPEFPKTDLPCLFCVGGLETEDFRRQTYLASMILKGAEEKNIYQVENANHLNLLTKFAQNQDISSPIINRLIEHW